MSQVVLSADAPLRQLFTAQSTRKGYGDSDRMLMDDLKIAPENATANVFSGDEEAFAFDRTVSRLSEMQSETYWAQWSKMSH